MRIILLTKKQSGETECFSTLKPFFEKYSEYEKNRDNINTYLSRKKQAFETDEIKVQRLEVQRSL